MHFETCKYQGGQSRGLPGWIHGLKKVRNRTSQVRKNVYNFSYTKSNFMGYSANPPSYFSTQDGFAAVFQIALNN